MLSLTLKCFAIAVISATAITANDCPADRPKHPCCQKLEPYSEGKHYFNDYCGIKIEDESTIMGEGCLPPIVGGW